MKRFGIVWTSASAAALLMSAGVLTSTAMADPPLPAILGQTAQGTLSPSDAKADDNTLYDDYTVRLSANQGVEALLSSSAFDPIVHLGRGTGSAFESLKSDDDSGGGTDARLRFAAPADGVYTVRAKALSEDMRGAYALRLSAYTPPPPAVPRAIGYGGTMSGVLAEGGSRLDEGDKLYDEYTFTAAAGDRIKLETAASQFDSTVQLGRMVAGSFEEIKSDDDSAGEKNARLLAVLESGGEHTVRVAAFDSESKGAYAVTLTRLPPAAPAPRPKTIRIGQVLRGEFTPGNATFAEFRPYDYFTLSGRAGQTATIIMRAEFDANLDVGVMSPGGYAVLTSNDDEGPGSTNSKIDFKFEESGSVLIRASALSTGAVGTFTVTVE